MMEIYLKAAKCTAKQIGKGTIGAIKKLPEIITFAAELLFIFWPFVVGVLLMVWCGSLNNEWGIILSGLFALIGGVAWFIIIKQYYQNLERLQITGVCD